MSDFLPIGLGRDGAGNVSHFQEITSSDSIPENYLQIANTTAKWNASALQNIPVCTNTPTGGQSLVYNSSLGVWCASTVTAEAVVVGETNACALKGFGICTTTPNPGDSLVYNGTQWCPSAAGGGGGITGPVSVTAGNAVVWTNATTIDDGGWGITPTALGDGKVVYWNNSTKQISNTGFAPTDAGWNANKIQGTSACPDAPSGGQFLVYNAAINAWCPSTITDNTGVTGTGVTDKIVKWTNATTIGDAGFKVTLPLSSGKIIAFDLATTALVDSGFAPTDAGWNANKIQGVSANPAPPNDGQVWAYDLANSRWTPSTLNLTGATGTLDGDGTAGRLAIWTGVSTLSGWNPAITDGHILEWDSSTSAPVSTGYKRTDVAWNAASADGYEISFPPIVPNADAFVMYDKATGTITTDTKIKFISTLGQFQFNQQLVTSSNLIVSGNLTVYGSDAINVPNGDVNVSGAVITDTVSATNYLNLPSSTMVWASANYATLAGSSTSSLNAQQAPNGFNVTGTLLATTVSATNYRNIRPYVSSVDSATTTTVNMGGDYDLYLVNTTTTSVTLYLPAASAWTSKQITVSKVDDGGSYRSVTLSGATLQTATQTVRLYDPTESVTVISNGTNWYSLDYDRAYGVVVVAKNSTGSTLTKGTPVKVTGATGDNVLIGAVSAANNHVPQATNGNLTRCIGVVEHDIPNGEFGHVLTKGTLYKFNTNAYNEGDVLYLASGGGFTNVKPPAPYDEVFLGIVTRKQSVNGSILIDIANPIHINDIVGFNLASSLVNGDLISYSTATSTFTNVQTVNVSGQGKFGSVSATDLSATNITATDLTFSGKISSQKYPTYIYTATGISVAANKLMFDMFNGTGSGKTLKVTRIVAYVRNTTSITGINQVLECYRTSSVGTGGTAITAGKMVTTDPDLNANITARNTPTNNAAYYIPSGVLAAANIYTEEGQNLQERVFLYVYDSFAGLEECLTLQEGEGLRIITGSQGAAGVIAIYAYFITV